MKLRTIILLFSLIIFLFNFRTLDAKAAQTTQQLLEQIAQLQAQIVELQGHLEEIQKSSSWCHNFDINLKISDNTQEVKYLQEALYKEGLYEQEVTGNYDEYTASVVVAFQEKYKNDILTPLGLKNGTGYVGKSTRTKLNNIYGCGTKVKTEELRPPIIFYPYDKEIIYTISPIFMFFDVLDNYIIQEGTWEGDKPLFGTEFLTWGIAAREGNNQKGPVGTFKWNKTYTLVARTCTDETFSKCSDWTQGVTFTIMPKSPCTDSDGGKNYQLKGEVSVDGESFMEDSCLWEFKPDISDRATLMDYYCTGDQNNPVWFEQYKCPNGCKNGACIDSLTLPVITGINPIEGFQGQTVDTVITGYNFTGARDYSGCGISPVSDRGFSLVSCNQISDTKINAQFSITATAEVRTRNISVQTPKGGRSNSISFKVSSTTITPSVNFIYPNGGEVLREGERGEIKFCGNNFSPTGPGGFSHIYLIKGGSVYGLIYKDTTSGIGGCPGNDLYYWTIGKLADGSTVPTGNDYKIKIDFINQSGVIYATGQSKNYFGIDSLTTTCTDSDGGKNLYVKGTTTGISSGSDYPRQITMTDKCFDATHIFEYYCSNNMNVINELFGNYFASITEYCADGCVDGACKQTSGICGDGSCSDPETCTTCQVDCGICVPPAPILSPWGEEKWQRGTSHVIRWTSSGYASSVIINLYLNGTYQKSLTGAIPDSYGQWTWNIPADQTIGSQYSIRVSRLSYPKDFIADSNYFSITENSSITILSPNGGEKWEVGKAYNITWRATGFEKAIIMLTDYSCSSETPIIIATNIPASQGSYSWTIPDDFFEARASAYCPTYIYNPVSHYGWKSGDNFKFFVGQLNSNGTYGAQDQSDNYFSIVSKSVLSVPCTDSDGGKNYDVRGVGRGIYAGTSGSGVGLIFGEDPNKETLLRTDPTLSYSIYYDHCTDSANSKQIDEAFCDSEGKLASHGINCTYGCKDGVCLSAPSCMTYFDNICPAICSITTDADCCIQAGKIWLNSAGGYICSP